jgi:hypothetical protein
MTKLQSIAAAVLLAGAASFTIVGCKTHEHMHGSEAASSAAAKPYPLDKCVVSNEAFEHGKPYVFVHNGQEIKLCCKDCLADFNKDPRSTLPKSTQPNNH